MFSRALAQELAALLKEEEGRSRCVEYQWEDAYLGRMIRMIAHRRAVGLSNAGGPSRARPNISCLDLGGSPAACGRTLEQPLVFYHLYGSYVGGRAGVDCSCTVFDQARTRCTPRLGAQGALQGAQSTRSSAPHTTAAHAPTMRPMARIPPHVRVLR